MGINEYIDSKRISFFFQFKQSHLICNGEVDCLDGTDEKDCLICAKDEYACRKSKKCVLKTARCDGTVDCAQKEDEANCGK